MLEVGTGCKGGFLFPIPFFSLSVIILSITLTITTTTIFRKFPHCISVPDFHSFLVNLVVIFVHFAKLRIN